MFRFCLSFDWQVWQFAKYTPGAWQPKQWNFELSPFCSELDFSFLLLFVWLSVCILAFFGSNFGCCLNFNTKIFERLLWWLEHQPVCLRHSHRMMNPILFDWLRTKTLACLRSLVSLGVPKSVSACLATKMHYAAWNQWHPYNVVHLSLVAVHLVVCRLFHWPQFWSQLNCCCIWIKLNVCICEHFHNVITSCVHHDLWFSSKKITAKINFIRQNFNWFEEYNVRLIEFHFWIVRKTTDDIICD